MFTAFVLGYGPHAALMDQCLTSIASGLQTSKLESIRVGLNAPDAALLACIGKWVDAGVLDPSDVYLAENNAGKYPVMRQMFHNPRRPITTEFVMWFDDDSFINTESMFWWDRVAGICKDYDLVGQPWVAQLTQARRKWLETMPWAVPSKIVSPFKFMQGAWWCLRTARMREADWPLPILHHNGGDTLLGVMSSCLGWRTRAWADDMLINAGFTGGQSKAHRRGINDPALGNNWVEGQVLPLAPVPVFTDFGTAYEQSRRN